MWNIVMKSDSKVFSSINYLILNYKVYCVILISPNKTEYNCVRKRIWRKKKKLDEKYIEKVRNYDRTRKRENKILSPIYSSPKGPSYYSVLGRSKEIRTILGDSPKTHATILTHVVRHAMKSPRKSKYITVDTKPTNYHPTTPKEDRLMKQLRKIAVL